VRALGAVGGDGLTGDRVRAEVAKASFDGVSVTCLVDVSKETIYVPPITITIPIHQRSPYRDLSVANTEVRTPGHLQETKIVRVETNFYAVAGEPLAYSPAEPLAGPLPALLGSEEEGKGRSQRLGRR
jgi:hypothetical protein